MRTLCFVNDKFSRIRPRTPHSNYIDAHTVHRLRRAVESGLLNHERKRWHSPKPMCVRQIQPEDLQVSCGPLFITLIYKVESGVTTIVLITCVSSCQTKQWHVVAIFFLHFPRCIYSHWYRRWCYWWRACALVLSYCCWNIWFGWSQRNWMRIESNTFTDGERKRRRKEKLIFQYFAYFNVFILLHILVI